MSSTPDSNRRPAAWTTRPEQPGADEAAVREVLLAAFSTSLEADLVDGLRTDPEAWLPGLSIVSTTVDGTVAGYSLLTRCHVGGAPALALGPCAVRPEHRSRGAGAAAIRAGLDAARRAGESLVVVLGHAEYYPRFGFDRASLLGITATFEVPDENLMALVLDSSRPVPVGQIRYASAFGV